MESAPILSPSPSHRTNDAGTRPWRLHCCLIGAIITLIALVIGGGALAALYYAFSARVHAHPSIFVTVYSTASAIGALARDPHRAGPHLCFTMPDENSIRCLLDSNDAEVIAGGTQGFTDGPARQAQFHGPMGLVVHPRSGVLYIADSGNDRVRMLNPSNQTVATLPRTFSKPHSLAVSPITGDLFVADGSLSNMTIWMVSQSGNVSTALVTDLHIADGSAALASNRIAVDRTTGLLYYVKAADSEVWQLSPDTAATVRVGSGLGDIVGVTVDNGAVYAFGEDAIVSMDGTRLSGFYEMCPRDSSERLLPAVAVAALAENGSIVFFADNDDTAFRIRMVGSSLCHIDNPNN